MKKKLQAQEQNHSTQQLQDVMDMETLDNLITENEQIETILVADSKELEEIDKGFAKKRVKVADAQIRSIANKRVKELEVVQLNLKAQMEKLISFEDALEERRKLAIEHSATGDLAPEKQAMLQEALDDLKAQFNEFKSQYDKVAVEIKNVSGDIARRDLENSEPLTMLAKDIENLKAHTFHVKELKFDLDKITISVQRQAIMLSSMETEKRLSELNESVEV